MWKHEKYHTNWWRYVFFFLLHCKLYPPTLWSCLLMSRILRVIFKCHVMALSSRIYQILCVISAEPCQCQLYLVRCAEPFDRTLFIRYVHVFGECECVCVFIRLHIICRMLSLLTVQQLFTYVTWWILAIRKIRVWLTPSLYPIFVYNFNCVILCRRWANHHHLLHL